MPDPEKTRQREDRYEYLRRTLAEDREERRRRRKISYLLRTGARRGYENLMRSKIWLLMCIVAVAALSVSLNVPATSLTYHLASLVWHLWLGVWMLVEGVIGRKRSSDWMEVGGVLQKRPFSKWSANMTIAFGVILCLIALTEIPRLLR